MPPAGWHALCKADGLLPLIDSPGPLRRALNIFQELCMSEIRRRRFLAGAALAAQRDAAARLVFQSAQRRAARDQSS